MSANRKSSLSRRRFVAGASGVAAAAAALPKTVFAQKKVTVKYTLAWLPEGANIWSYAAKSFWAKEGIDVVGFGGKRSHQPYQDVVRRQRGSSR